MRPLREADVHPAYISGLNDPMVNKYLDGVKHTSQTERSVLEFVFANRESKNAVLFGIWQTGVDTHCGTIRLHGIEHQHKTAHIGICLFDKDAWGKGFGTSAVTAVTHWAFEALGLRWIEAGVYQENIASQKTFLKAGYEWIYDIPDKYILEGSTAVVRVFAARRLDSQSGIKN